MSHSITASERQQIEELRQEHIGRLLLRAQRDFSERSIEKLRKFGHDGLSLAHTNLLANLDLEGTRITTLAERAGVSKQAMGHLVIELEEKGYIKRAADTKDQRATLINYTEGGWKFLQDASLVKREIEAEYVAVLGEAGLQNLKLLLTEFLNNGNRGLTGQERSVSGKLNKD